MSDCFTVSGGDIVAQIIPGANSVYATGCPEWPILVFQFHMNFHGPRSQGAILDFKELRCRLSPFDGSHIGASLPTSLQLRLGAGRHHSNQLIYIEVPLDRGRIAFINRLRQGRDVKFRLDLELTAEEMTQIKRLPGVPEQSIWGFIESHRMRTQTTVQVSCSQWIERVLNATDFGKVHIIELPAIPVEMCSEIREAFNALQQAHKFEKEGLYADAVSKCRLALEPFFETVEKDDGKGGKRKVPQLKASWETRLGKATYEWLDISFTAIKFPMNQAHHTASRTFDQLEAQMLLTVTASLIAYAVKTSPDNQ